MLGIDNVIFVSILMFRLQTDIEGPPYLEIAGKIAVRICLLMVHKFAYKER